MLDQACRANPVLHRVAILHVHYLIAAAQGCSSIGAAA
jgi:hypothetical protein